LIILGAFAFDKYDEYQDEKKNKIGMELFESGLIKFENTKISFGITGKVSGKIINESDKVIDELRIRLQLKDITKNMVYDESFTTVYTRVPPNQIRSFDDYHFLDHTPKDIANELVWKVVRVSASEPD
jgi:hypothetical protein